VSDWCHNRASLTSLYQYDVQSVAARRTSELTYLLSQAVAVWHVHTACTDLKKSNLDKRSCTQR
jgi:hypothetical protein